MPGLFYITKPAVEIIDDKIKTAKRILDNTAKPDDREKNKLNGLYESLDARITEFKTELEKFENDAIEKGLILDQYNRFASTLFECVKHPKGTSSYINTFHNTFYYHPVCVNEVQKPNPIIDLSFRGACFSGIVLIILSAPAFIINPIFGGVLLGMGSTLTLSSIPYFITPESKDNTSKKLEERFILEEAAKIVDPALEFISHETPKLENTGESYKIAPAF